MELLTGLINKRLGQTAVKSAGISLSRKCGSLTDAEIDRIAETLKNFTLTATGTKGWNRHRLRQEVLIPLIFIPTVWNPAFTREFMPPEKYWTSTETAADIIFNGRGRRRDLPHGRSLKR